MRPIYSGPNESGKLRLKDFINNGNRTEWSPIWSVIIVLQNWTTAKRESNSFNHEYDSRLNSTTQRLFTS